MDPSPRVLIVSPVKNEAAHLEAVIRAVAAQDFPPARWIVVDDGSSDGTPAIARRLAADIPFMDVLDEGVGRGGRDPLAEGAAPKAFNRGLALADLGEFTHVMKLDGDVELPPDYPAAGGRASCFLLDPAEVASARAPVAEMRS